MISYKDLGLLILFLILSSVGVYTFILLINLNGILKKVKELMDKNMSNIDKTLDRLPSIANSIDDVAADVKLGVGKVSEAVEIVGDTVSETVLSVSDGAFEAVEYLKVIAEVIKIFMKTFVKK